MMVSELGEVPAAIVYRTDAMKSSKIKIIGTFPETSHKPITYVAFYDFLNSEETKAIWESFGFIK